METVKKDFQEIHVAKFDCSVYRPICEGVGVQEFPSIVWMKKGKIANFYKGEYDVESLKSYVFEMIKPIPLIEDDDKSSENIYVDNNQLGDGDKDQKESDDDDDDKVEDIDDKTKVEEEVAEKAKEEVENAEKDPDVEGKKLSVEAEYEDRTSVEKSVEKKADDIDVEVKEKEDENKDDEVEDKVEEKETETEENNKAVIVKPNLDDIENPVNDQAVNTESSVESSSKAPSANDSSDYIAKPSVESESKIFKVTSSLVPDQDSKQSDIKKIVLIDTEHPENESKLESSVSPPIIPPNINVVNSSMLKAEYLELSSENFTQSLNPKGVTFVMMYAPWCHKCDVIRETLKSISYKFAKVSSIRLAQINCVQTENIDICTDFGMKGIPTLNIYRDGNTTPILNDYNGTTVEQLEDCIVSHRTDEGKFLL